MQWGGTMVVAQTALASRALVLLAMFFWARLGAPYDTSATLDPPCLSENADNVEGDGVEGHFSAAIERSVVWDGVYCLRIARCGYEYEQMHAFQPLLPLLMRLFSNTALRGFITFLGYRATLALAGYLISILAFVLAAMYLYRLSLYVLEDEHMAVISTAFFCFNPASVFYSAIYSESLFAFLSFSGMWYFVRGSKWKAVLLFGLSGIARSNGVLHAGFFLFQALHLVFHNVIQEHRPLLAGSIILRTVFQVACVIAPFIAFQSYGYYQICWQNPNDLSQRPWCKARIPYLYGFVQSHYWDVGFLRYFQIKQLPNFMSASPALLLASFAIVKYARGQPKLFYSLGLAASPAQRQQAALLLNKKEKPEGIPVGNFIDLSGALNDSKSSERLELRHRVGVKARAGAAFNRSSKQDDLNANAGKGFFSPANVAFVFELLFMAAVAFFIMHVQVSTRFLSSSPVVYWYAASMQKRRRTSYIIWSIFLSYILVGTLLFVNFYPFT